MSLNLNIDHIRLSLHDVPQQIVEQAMSGLQPALIRRIGALRELQMNAAPLQINVAELALGPMQQTGVMDAARLRGLIVDQLVGQLQEQITQARGA